MKTPIKWIRIVTCAKRFVQGHLDDNLSETSKAVRLEMLIDAVRDLESWEKKQKKVRIGSDA